jgi:hypothetical protein
MRLFLSALALCALSSAAFADSAGKYGNGHSSPRVIVETRIIATQNQLQVRFSHGGDTSAWRDASEDPNGDGYDAWDSPEGASTGGRDFRFDGGEAQYKSSSGHWIDLGRKRKGNPIPAGAEYVTAGDKLPGDGLVREAADPDARWFESTAGNSFGYDVFYIPGGDDVTTLPDDPGN